MRRRHWPAQAAAPAEPNGEVTNGFEGSSAAARRAARSRSRRGRHHGAQRHHLPRHGGAWPTDQQHPENTVEALSAKVHVAVPGTDETRYNSVAGLGPLTGLVAGVGTGALLGLARAAGWRPRLLGGGIAARSVRWPAATVR